MRITPRSRGTDLVLEFDPEELRARLLSADGRVSHRGVDARVKCKSCAWTSKWFPYDPWSVRGFAEEHFEYVQALRVYRCNA